jgi:hypothetical protein
MSVRVLDGLPRKLLAYLTQLMAYSSNAIIIEQISRTPRDNVLDLSDSIDGDFWDLLD